MVLPLYDRGVPERGISGSFVWVKAFAAMTCPLYLRFDIARNHQPTTGVSNCGPLLRLLLTALEIIVLVSRP